MLKSVHSGMILLMFFAISFLYLYWLEHCRQWAIPASRCVPKVARCRPRCRLSRTYCDWAGSCIIPPSYCGFYLNKWFIYSLKAHTVTTIIGFSDLIHYGFIKNKKSSNILILKLYNCLFEWGMFWYYQLFNNSNFKRNNNLSYK